MGPFSTLLGSAELRSASRAPWKSQLQPVNWTCSECRSRRALQRRNQHTDAQAQILSASKDGPQRAIYQPIFDASSDKSQKNNSAPLTDKSAFYQPIPFYKTFPKEPTQDLKPEVTSDSDFEYLRTRKAELREALARREPYRLLTALQAGRNSPGFYDDLPSTTITEILKLLDPDYLVSIYQDAYYDMSDSKAFNMGRVPLQKVLEGYVASLRNIVANMSRAGKRLRLADYRCLLRAIRVCALGRESEGLWADMKKAAIVPDTACYNEYLAATCWDGLHSSTTRHSFRLTPYTMLARSRQKRGSKFVNYRVGKYGKTIKAVMTRLVQEMRKNGTPANEETFAHVMTALSREGDMGGVKDVLASIFLLDVDAIMSDSSIAKPPLVPTSSPFYPTETLLFTIAHIFGSNNDIPAALRLVDHISQLYSLPVPLATWRELLYWTFVLTVPHYGRLAAEWFENIGSLPGTSFNQLFKTMINSPYDLTPTMEIIKWLMSNSRRIGEWDLMRVYIGRAKKIYSASRDEHLAAYKDYLNAERHHMLGRASRERVHHARAVFESKDVIRARNLRTMRGFVHMILGKPTLAHIPTDNDLQWDRRDVPDIVWENRKFVPHLIRYRTIGGVVELELRNPEEIEESARTADLTAMSYVVDNPTTTTGQLVDTHGVEPPIRGFL